MTLILPVNVMPRSLEPALDHIMVGEHYLVITIVSLKGCKRAPVEQKCAVSARLVSLQQSYTPAESHERHTLLWGMQMTYIQSSICPRHVFSCRIRNI